MHEHRITVARSARYYTLDPALETHAVWFVLHGYGQQAAHFLRAFDAIQNGHRLIVAPEALSRFYLQGHDHVGASWMTREDRDAEIHDYIVYLDAVYDEILASVDRDQVRVIVLGFSQGATTTSRWVTMGKARADRLILWEGHLAHDLDFARGRDILSRLGLTIVAGTDDDYLTPERLVAQETVLIQHSIPYRLFPFKGGHQINADVLQSLADDVRRPQPSQP